MADYFGCADPAIAAIAIAVNRAERAATELGGAPDKASGCSENPLDPVQQMRTTSAQRQPATIFGLADAACSRCGCEIVQFYGGTDEFFKKARRR